MCLGAYTGCRLCIKVYGHCDVRSAAMSFPGELWQCSESIQGHRITFYTDLQIAECTPKGAGSFGRLGFPITGGDHARA